MAGDGRSRRSRWDHAADVAQTFRTGAVSSNASRAAGHVGGSNDLMTVRVGNSGVTAWSPEGKLIGRIRLPEVRGNVCFGDPKRNRLFRGITVLRRKPRGGFDCRYSAWPCEIRDRLGGKGKS
jgi:sugar lactone lactonase YvrE